MSSGGSSPRMRGTPINSGRERMNARFIPAHAGNTTPRASSACNQPVHPRACGEHFSHSIATHRRCGSSPRMRGTLIDKPIQSAIDRFIPAHAGNTLRCVDLAAPEPVHPRACGEHWPEIRAQKNPHGSSPRMRGTRHAAHPQSRRGRFIPAHAGNTA